MTKGKIIVLEGPDGSGKNTQATLLFNRLKELEYVVHTMDFPRYTQTVMGAFIRDCQQGKHGDFVNTDPYLASFPYALDRFQERHTLCTWLDSGAIVILDRYVSANQIHQGGKIASEKERVKFLSFLDLCEHEILGIPRPDTVVYLNVPVEISLELLNKKRDKVNQIDNDLTESDIEYQKNTRIAASFLMETQPSWQMISCTESGVLRSPEDIAEEVYQKIVPYL